MLPRVWTEVSETRRELFELELILDRRLEHPLNRLIVDVGKSRRLPVWRTPSTCDARGDALAVIMRLDEMRGEAKFELESAHEIERFAAVNLLECDLERCGR